MPPVRGEDEEERHDEHRQDAVEVHLVRRELGAEDRQRGEATGRLPRLAAHREEEGRHARRRENLQEESLPLLGDFADVAQGRGAQGGHLRRRDAPRQGAVVLIASDDRNALGWHLARTEGARAWSSLMSRIAALGVAVSDGGDGLAKALRGTWPGTRRQRCTFHALSQARRYTTSRHRTQACAEPYGLARALLGITALRKADGWAQALLAWLRRWDALLSETSVGEDRRPRLVHERLVKARRSLVRLAGAGMFFTYLDPGLVRDGALPATSNSIEGGVNARLRAMFRDHRGLSMEGAQGGLLVVLRAQPGPAARGGDPTGHAHRPLHRRDLRAAGREGEARGSHPAVGRRRRVVGAPPLGALPDGLGLTGHTFCPICLVPLLWQLLGHRLAQALERCSGAADGPMNAFAQSGGWDVLPEFRTPLWGLPHHVHD